MHPRLAQHAVEDFQLGDALVGVMLHPAVAGEGLPVEAFGHVAVAFAQQAEEERPAVLDLLQTEIEGEVVVGLFPGDAPAQVNVHEVDAILGQLLAQLREHNRDQMVPFRVHVAECAADEDTYGFPR